MPTAFEFAYPVLESFLLPVNRLVRSEIRRLLAGMGSRPRLLDIGGRKSHYTIGVPADVTVTDLPRESEIQKHLYLGINADIMRQTLARRSNVQQVVLDDMTRSTLPSHSFDMAVSVEVLEHVEQDEDFVRNVAKVLRPGGVFLMTTPNGDFVPNTNPDHKRHYSRELLRSLLARHFQDVQVWYAVKDSPARNRGLKSFSPRRPVVTLRAMIGNLVNSRESRSPELATQATGTRHLFAVARARNVSEQPA